MNQRELQELTLAVMPQWHYRMARPFKKLICDGINPEMYFCIQMMRGWNGCMTMTELSKTVQMSKQQATHLVDRLIKEGLVRRANDPSDRRIVRLEVTPKASDYVEQFMDEEAAYYRDLFASMTEADRERFAGALQTLHEIFNKLPCDCRREKEGSRHEKTSGLHTGV